LVERLPQTLAIAGRDVRVVTAALFIATKVEAFHGRGGDDVRDYIGTEIRSLLDNQDFRDALAGFLLPDAASQARLGLADNLVKIATHLERRQAA